MAKSTRKKTRGRKSRKSKKKSPSPARRPSPRRNTKEAEHLELARAVQRGLLPPQHLEVPGYELAMRNLPSEELGGDFCDFFALEDNTLGLYLGDVQGKGVGAALHALLISGVMRGMHKSGHTPADVVCLLNRRLSFRSVPDRFSCIGYAIIGLEDRRLTFASAGVPFPLLLRGGEVSRIELTGRPVGMFETGHYDQVSVDLQPGDTVLFHTDGVADSLSSNRKKVPDGEEKLERLFASLNNRSAAAMADALKAGLDGNGKRRRPLRDDATFIILRVV